MLSRYSDIDSSYGNLLYVWQILTRGNERDKSGAHRQDNSFNVEPYPAPLPQ